MRGIWVRGRRTRWSGGYGGPLEVQGELGLGAEKAEALADDTVAAVGSRQRRSEVKGAVVNQSPLMEPTAASPSLGPWLPSHQKGCGLGKVVQSWYSTGLPSMTPKETEAIVL